jgi:hypothetical protein
MTRAAVYQIATATDIIAAAREAGFRSVEFSNAPYGGQWLFDLTKAGKACAADLCF